MTTIRPSGGGDSAIATYLRRRSILIVANRTGPVAFRGGMSAFILRLAHELATHHDVTLASHPNGEADGLVGCRQGEKFSRVEPRDVCELARLADRHDLVLVNQWRYLVTHPDRTVLMMHGGIHHSYPDDFASESGRRRMLSDLAKPAALAACSNWAATTIAEFVGREVSTLYPPVDSAFFSVSPETKRPVVGYAGRLSTYKGADLVPNIAVDPRLKGTTFEMTNLTPDENIESVIHAAADAGLVRLIDPIHDTSVMSRYLSSLKIALVPSRVEGFGLSAIEAQVSGTFVVAAAVEGLHESVLPGGGVLVQPTIDNFVEALIEHWGSVPDISVRAIAAERFSTSATASRLLSLL